MRSSCAHLREKLGGTNRLPKYEIPFRPRTRPWFPPRHDADSQLRPSFPRDCNQVPTAAVRQADIGDEDVIRSAAVLLDGFELCGGVAYTCHSIDHVPVRLQ